MLNATENVFAENRASVTEFNSISACLGHPDLRPQQPMDPSWPMAQWAEMEEETDTYSPSGAMLWLVTVPFHIVLPPQQ